LRCRAAGDGPRVGQVVRRVDVEERVPRTGREINSPHTDLVGEAGDGAGARVVARPGGTNGVSPGMVSSVATPRPAAQSRPASTPARAPWCRKAPSGSTGRPKAAKRAGSPL